MVRQKALLVVAIMLLGTAGAPARADVFDMGPGLTSLETVRVADAGNAGELTGAGAGGFGPNRVSGAVGYAYDIGKYEVTAGQYCEFLNAVAATDNHGLYNSSMWTDAAGCKIQRSGESGGYTYRVTQDYANRPVDFVSFWDACRFANWLHNGQGNGDTETGAYALTPGGISGNTVTRNAGWKWAVTSEDEWYKAAYYDPAASGYFDYPTSSNSLPGRDLSDASGNNANYYGDPYPIQSSHFSTVVGEFQNSASPCGTFDQGGNTTEWTDEIVWYGEARGNRGSSYDIDCSTSQMLSSFHDYNLPTSESRYLGFRVSAVPEPATIGLLALGGLGLLRRGTSGGGRKRR